MRKAQSALEVTVVIAVFVAALLGMVTYIKRGIQGNFRSSADQLGSEYEPEKTTADRTYTDDSFTFTESVTVEDGNKVKTIATSNGIDSTNRSGWEEVEPLQ